MMALVMRFSVFLSLSPPTLARRHDATEELRECKRHRGAGDRLPHRYNLLDRTPDRRDFIKFDSSGKSPAS